MATHEVVAGLGFSSELAELGIVGDAELAASFDATAGIIQNLQLSAALGFRAGLVGQGADAALTVSAMLAGESTVQEGKSQHTQPYRVIGLSHQIPEGRLFEAREAPGVPLEGAPHPVEPGIHVIAKRASFENPKDQTRAIVQVTYGLPLSTDLEEGGGASGMGLLSLSPATYTETVWNDADGNFMTVTYTAGSSRFRRAISAEVQRKTWTATLTKTFSSPQYVDMLRPSSINSEYFAPFAARTLLFIGPTINETDDGKYVHGYQMTYKPDTWLLRSSIWVGGLVPHDATEVYNPIPFWGGTGDGSTPGGLALFQINSEFDFNELPVAFP